MSEWGTDSQRRGGNQGRGNTLAIRAIRRHGNFLSVGDQSQTLVTRNDMSFYKTEPADDLDAPDDREYTTCDLCDKRILDGAADNGRIGRLYLCPECYDAQESVIQGRAHELRADERRGK